MVEAHNHKTWALFFRLHKNPNCFEIRPILVEPAAPLGSEAQKGLEFLLYNIYNIFCILTDQTKQSKQHLGKISLLAYHPSELRIFMIQSVRCLIFLTYWLVKLAFESPF